MLVEGTEDAAELEIPAPGTAASAGTGDSAHAGRGYLGHLDAIGPEGFLAPILRAAAAFVASNWPAPDLDALRADLRERILSADPGGRTAAQIADRASDRHLNGVLAWVVARERSKREARAAEAAAAKAAATAVAPTYPDRGIPLEEAQAQAKAAIGGRFAKRVAAGESPEMLLRMTVGGGKSDAAIKSADVLHAAARDGDQERAVFILLPRHDLGAELLARVRAEKPGMRAALVKGIEWKNPDDPNDVMCLDPELPDAAKKASQPTTSVCVACRFDGVCPYTLQRDEAKGADVVLMAHNHAFQHKPAFVPDPGVVVFDEAFWPSGIKGNDALHPVQLAVSSLRDERTGAVTGIDRERLLWLRRRAADALEGHGKGGLLREALVAAGLTEENAGEWLSLEWQTKPEVKITDGMARGEVLDALNKAAAQGFTRLRPMLAEHARDLLAGDDARCVNATVIPDAPLGGDQGTGPVVRFAWREDFAEWVANAPKLILDATTHEEVVKAWLPDVEVVDIEIQAPGQHVRQIIGREFGRSFFAQCPSNVERLADFLMVELARSTGEVVVIVQLAIETPLREAIRRRLEGALPNRLHIAHHGAITGLDAFRDAERVVVVGRPATDRIAGERLGELAKGGPVDTVTDAEDTRWPTVTAAIRMADGSGVPVRQPRHPDPLVEAFRFSITEGAVIQAAGRGRGVRRPEDRPVFVTILGEMALPLTVHEVATWDDAVPNRLEVAAAEAALARRALPLAPADLARARPDLWVSPNAADLDLKRARKGGRGLISTTHKALTPLSGMGVAEYRKAGGRGSLASALVPLSAPGAALEAEVGELADFKLASPAPPPPPGGGRPVPSSPPELRAPGAPPGGELEDAPELDALGLPLEVLAAPPPALLRRLAERAGGRPPRVLVLGLLPEAVARPRVHA